jgi:hypothetical protein
MSQLSRSSSNPVTNTDWNTIIEKITTHKQIPVKERYQGLEQILNYSDGTIKSGYSHILIVNEEGGLVDIVIDPQKIEYEGNGLVTITGRHLRRGERDSHGNRAEVSSIPTEIHINVEDGVYAYGVPISLYSPPPISKDKERPRSAGGKKRKSRKSRKSSARRSRRWFF